MAYVPEGSEITFMHTALHFHVSSGGALKKADHHSMLRTVPLRLLNNYPVDPLQCRRRRRLYLIFINNNINFVLSGTTHTLFVSPNIAPFRSSADGPTTR